MQSQIRPLEVSLEFRVKTYEIDFAGIVSNTVYVRWLEDLRLKLLDEYFPLDQQLKRGIAPILWQTHIEYKRPIRLDDKVRGILWTSALDGLKWTVAAEFITNGKLSTRASQVGVFVHLPEGKMITMPEEMSTPYLAALAQSSSVSGKE